MPCSDVWCSTRLPTNIVPYHYDLFIKAFVDDLKFEGTQVVSFDVTMETDKILIHIEEMEIDAASVKVESLSELDFSCIFMINYFAQSTSLLSHDMTVIFSKI